MRTHKVRNLVMQTMRESTPIAYDKRRAPCICAQKVGKPLPGTRRKSSGLSHVVLLTGHRRDSRCLERVLATSDQITEPERILVSLRDGGFQLHPHVILEIRLGNGETVGVTGKANGSPKLELCEMVHIAEVERVLRAMNVTVGPVGR